VTFIHVAQIDSALGDQSKMTQVWNGYDRISRVIVQSRSKPAWILHVLEHVKTSDYIE